ncbi:fluoroquinolone transport system ATP-binding protein [Erythrobacter litoralis]|uniref:ABC transporter domain-containing protein n=1 Tax=Erythrobacter litoralis TaxID=39960 RepID=A0A074M8C8_9SPHN|nr:ABC transporter ATP-binding protein [Erythrobacter litoralis]AOL22356.1 fluoroquinolone transport system ATP-binding protein [Erythrobacter litoralis]KEO89644.1 hypothetical protein EH32_03840 [Erythrobacter litoralis]
MTDTILISTLRFGYRRSQEVLKGLDLTVREGEVFGILGPSGSGKSTLQSILLGFEKNYSGTVRVLGCEARNLAREFYRRVGVSFELPAAYQQLTARENLELFASLQGGTEPPLDEVLAQVDLLEHASKRVQDLSKGMKIRLNLARALLHDPELYFLDEPTSGQDPARVRLISSLILNLKARGKTILMATHDMAVAERICDRVGFLIAGRIVKSGAPSNLKRSMAEPRVEVAHRAGESDKTETFPLAALGENSRFRELLAADRIVSLRSVEPSLDDVFIKVATEISE